jgi:hypothetical protein
MIRQTLARREKLFGPEYPDTLPSMYSLAHLLANRHRYDEFIVLCERACAGYSTVLEKDHPTSRALLHRKSRISLPFLQIPVSSNCPCHSPPTPTIPQQLPLPLISNAYHSLAPNILQLLSDVGLPEMRCYTFADATHFYAFADATPRGVPHTHLHLQFWESDATT